MSMSNVSETNLLKLVFQNIAWADVGDASGLQPSSTAGDLFIALHTADPGEAGTQATSEADYEGYERVAVDRASGAGGFTVADNAASNASTVQFGECTSGTNILTYFSIGLESSGATDILLSGSLSAPRTVTAGITPLFNPGALSAEVD
jgi:hypothetical protein